MHSENPLVTSIKNNDSVAFNLNLQEYKNIQHNQYSNLMICARFNRPEFLINFLNQASNRSKTGQTALMFAAAECSIQCVKILINHELQLQDNYGFTALMFAAKKGNIEVCRLLSNELGAVTKFKNLNIPANIPSLYIAAVNNHEDIVKLLIDEINLIDHLIIQQIYEITKNDNMVKILLKMKNLDNLNLSKNEKVFKFEHDKKFNTLKSPVTPFFGLQNNGSKLKASLNANFDNESTTQHNYTYDYMDAQASIHDSNIQNNIVSPKLSLQDQIDQLNQEEVSSRMDEKKNQLIISINEQYGFDGCSNKMQIDENKLIKTFNYITGQRSKDILSDKSLDASTMNQSFQELKQDIKNSAVQLKQSISEHDNSIYLVPLSYIQRQKRLTVQTLEKSVQIIEQWQTLYPIKTDISNLIQQQNSQNHNYQEQNQPNILTFSASQGIEEKSSSPFVQQTLYSHESTLSKNLSNLINQSNSVVNANQNLMESANCQHFIEASTQSTQTLQIYQMGKYLLVIPLLFLAISIKLSISNFYDIIK
ncbi:Ankyrin repeat-containing protein [Spironucleus salmonicida]|uniref:Ankyrin repeat-containing protein n=1 Tax=Spironucleus salmonicida TaxID=348837 RepID=V6M742_9EUKA|nr:Ankyrin repeat-containing protein [Spironucleus salmonicida]|eukprot:EST49239.1 Ankyrin repeat-containing protein [Spironucleus salmonicida]